MDHAVALVQAYLELNGYFTSAELPIVTTSGRRRSRAVTDLDILAVRFPVEHRPPHRKRGPRGLDISELDSGLGVTKNAIDMIIGEVKEGRVGINVGIQDPEVLRTIVSRLVDPAETGHVIDALLASGHVRVRRDFVVRLVAFGAFPPGTDLPPCRIISLRHVVNFLESYVRRHWNVLRHLQFKAPALGFLMTLEKARRGEAGRRGVDGVEVVTGQRPRRKPLQPADT